MERIVVKFLYNLLKNNFVISEDQSGFKPGQSIMKQLIEIYHEFCKSCDKGKEIGVVYLVISKVFDRVWHILVKLAGIEGTH